MGEAELAALAFKSLGSGSPAGANGSGLGPVSSNAGPATLSGGNITFNKGEGWPMWAALAAVALALVVWSIKK